MTWRDLWFIAELSESAVRGSLSTEILFGSARGEEAKVYTPLVGEFPATPASNEGDAGRERDPDAGSSP